MNRSTGPIPPEKFKEIVDAPHGEARKVIREYDPLWGLKDGEAIKWEVKVQDGSRFGTATVLASSQKEADKLADDLTDADIDWDYGECDFTVISVGPYIERRK